MKTILIVSDHCWPEINPRAFRTNEIIEEFNRRGYRIKLVIPKNLGDKYKKYNNIEMYQYKTLIPKQGNNLNSAATPKSNNRKIKILNKIKNILFSIFINIFIEPEVFNIFWIKKKLKKINSKDIDIIISVALPYSSHKAVFDIYKKTKNNETVTIADYGDPICIGKKTKKPWTHNYFLYQEKKIIEWFDYISVPIEEATKKYEQYKNINNIIVLPQAVELTKFKIKEFIETSQITFAYAGLFYEEIRYPEIFFEYLVNLSEDFEFHVYTDIKQPATQKIIRKYENKLKGKLVVHDMIQRTECIYALSGYDFLINFKNKYDVQSPSKLIDYSIAGRPKFDVEFNGEFDNDLFRDNLKKKFNKNQYIDATQYDIEIICDKIEQLKGNLE